MGWRWNNNRWSFQQWQKRKAERAAERLALYLYYDV